MASATQTVTGNGMLVPVGSAELFVHPMDEPVGSVPGGSSAPIDRPVLLVVHGGPGGDHRNLVAPLAPLASVARLLFVDLRGHGLSSRPSPEACTLAQMADDLESLRQTLGLDPQRLTVLGVSFGGAVVLTLAHRYPAVWPRVVLSSASASYHADVAWAAWVRLHGTEAQASAAAAIVGGSLRDIAEARAAWGRVRPLYYADPAALPGPSGTHPSCLAEDVPPESIDMVNWWYRQGSREHDARPWLSSIRARTLVLAGRADPLGTPEQAHLLASGIPGAHLHIFEQSGHLSQIEEPAAYLDALGQFLTPQSPKPALSGCDA